MKKMAIVVGARPQFIKLAPLVSALDGRADLIIIHTGQHYDFELSGVFFEQLKLPRADYHLGVGSESHAIQTGNMMVELEKVFLNEKPSSVIVIGDTNSTLAGALAAVKINIPVIHIESGLRSKNKYLPEQINRVVVDGISSQLYCPDKTSAENLYNEDIKKGVHVTGDILYDLVRQVTPSEEFIESLLSDYNLNKGEFILLTMHRAENVDNREFLEKIIASLARTEYPYFLPLHPRTERRLNEFNLFDKLKTCKNVIISPPVGVDESLALIKSSLGVITDSGGIQREAAYFKKRAYVLRDETEWLELAKHGAVLCINDGFDNVDWDWSATDMPDSYFENASEKIANLICTS